MADAPARHSQVPAAYDVLAVLRYFGSQAGPVRAAALARDLGLPRSSTYHLLAALIAEGFVTHLPEERKYALGVRAYELGTGYARQAPLQRIARYPLARLAKTTRHSAHLAVMHGRDVVYVIEERGPRRRSLVTDIGVRLPAHATASGRAMLAWTPEAQIAALYPDRDAFAFAPRGGDTPRSPGELTRILRQVRSLGYAWEAGEVSEGFSSIAVVLDRMHHPVASLALTVADSGLLRDREVRPGGDGDRPCPAFGAVRGAGQGTGLPPRQAGPIASRWGAELVECAQELTRRLGAEPLPVAGSAPA